MRDRCSCTASQDISQKTGIIKLIHKWDIECIPRGNKAKRSTQNTIIAKDGKSPNNKSSRSFNTKEVQMPELFQTVTNEMGDEERKTREFTGGIKVALKQTCEISH